jgi:two-component system chemotaxis response regulator CheB
VTRIAVLIVDDSAVVRQVLTQILESDRHFEVLGAVADPVLAIERMKHRWPDVIVLDIEMPRMDGLTFLRKVMDERPTPVVICSTLASSGAPSTLEALSAGAVSVIEKPKIGLKNFLVGATAELVSAVKCAASARVRRMIPPRAVPAKLSADVIVKPARSGAMRETTEKVVAIGTSTGGTQALEAVLVDLRPDCPGIVIVQHMPEKFTAAFAQRLDGLCEIEVREARSGERVLPGHAFIAPGGKHLLLKRSGAYYVTEVVDGPLVNRHKPSVDVLFRSVAQCAGRNALGIIMTGMGNDGAHGLREMLEAGAHTIAQDRESCVVFGMPKEAIALGAAAEVLSLTRLAEVIGAATSIAAPRVASG